MREIEEAREALDRVERHVKRSRFMLMHPRETLEILHEVMSRGYLSEEAEGLAAQREIDDHIRVMEHAEDRERRRA